mmetsp:Transcript_34903/g.90439  ORF Transcript_34903/g.90439 Transcript_34903/m.90439 type:complete len:280 (-) Transcript_34903:1368-2207(-)
MQQNQHGHHMLPGMSSGRDLPHFARLLNSRDLGHFLPANVHGSIDSSLVGFPLQFDDAEQYISWTLSGGIAAFVSQLCNAASNAAAKRVQQQTLQSSSLLNASPATLPLHLNAPIPSATLSTLATANATGPLYAVQVTQGTLSDKARRGRGRPKGSSKRPHELEDNDKVDEPPEKRGRGRPKGSRNKKQSTVKLEPVDISSDRNLMRSIYGAGQEPPKKPRGRPKGSKSKLSILREVVDSGPLALSMPIYDQNQPVVQALPQEMGHGDLEGHITLEQPR